MIELDTTCIKRSRKKEFRVKIRGLLKKLGIWNLGSCDCRTKPS